MAKDDDNTWTKRFKQRRNMFLNALRGAVADFARVVCRPVDGSCSFGWQLERGVEPHPWESEGDLNFAISYCEHMIGQGLSVDFVVAYTPKQATIWVRAWEQAEQKPRWPRGVRPAVECQWCPVTDRSELQSE